MVVHRLHFHLDAAVVQNQNVAWIHVFDQLLVIDADVGFGTGFLVHVGIEDKALAGCQGDLVIGETGNPQFRALQVS